MRFLRLYVVLVGVPVLALLAVLRAGRDLAAPPSVGGEWRLEVAAPWSGATALHVVQSGRILELRLGDERGRGHLAPDGVALDGRVGEHALEARRTDEGLAGRLRRGGADAAFTATRVAGGR